jgi:hypothetical protein
MSFVGKRLPCDSVINGSSASQGAQRSISKRLQPQAHTESSAFETVLRLQLHHAMSRYVEACQETHHRRSWHESPPPSGLLITEMLYCSRQRRLFSCSTSAVRCGVAASGVRRPSFSCLSDHLEESATISQPHYDVDRLESMRSVPEKETTLKYPEIDRLIAHRSRRLHQHRCIGMPVICLDMRLALDHAGTRPLYWPATQSVIANSTSGSNSNTFQH